MASREAPTPEAAGAGPIGPTGLAQVWETVLQLRGQAGPRQVEGGAIGLCQTIGAGGVCVIHILRR